MYFDYVKICSNVVQLLIYLYCFILEILNIRVDVLTTVWRNALGGIVQLCPKRDVLYNCWWCRECVTSHISIECGSAGDTKCLPASRVNDF